MVGASRATGRRWLAALTGIPTASGREHAVMSWVEAWADKQGLRTSRDDAGNLIVRSRGRSRRSPVVAVAHADHPALVVLEAGATEAEAELRGGVLGQYVEGAAVELAGSRGRVLDFDSASGRARLQIKNSQPGDVVRWYFAPDRLGFRGDRLAAHACDDLAGAAAALLALNRAVAAGMNHLSVLLTRAEEVGFVGAIAAAQLGTIPAGASVLSIECSPASVDAPPGAGAVVRVGDYASIFSADLTNKVSTLLRARKMRFQRKLMAGGSCEATAFAGFGLNASGLCLPLVNHHNMVDVNAVREGRRKKAVLAPEQIDLGDFDGLVDLLVAVTDQLDRQKEALPFSLQEIYDEQRHVLV